MGKARIRRKIFNSDVVDLRPAMYWLWKHGVTRRELIDMFHIDANYISVSVHNQGLAETERKSSVVIPEVPDLTIAEDEYLIWKSSKDLDRIEDQIDKFGKSFWEHVRGLDGTLRLGESLRNISRPLDVNIPLLRFRAKLKHLLAETYLHAGYANTSIDFCNEAFEIQLDLYKDTHSRNDLKDYAKTMMLYSLANIMQENWKTSKAVLRIAEMAFEAANVPVDPELYRQQASIQMRAGKISEASALYKKAYDYFPAHREYLGYGEEKFYRHDVGVRPLAVLNSDIEAAERNLEIAREWPSYDIHRAINLNWAIATALRTGTPSSFKRAEELLEQARKESVGFGHQMTITLMLALTPRIPQHLQREWVIFALHYNAYRNK
jgi:tetratricopeptide (TPR) repeat protein